MVANSEVMVSIWCQTYNQSNYIRDALEGFVSQKTNFAYEIVVFDDASTDGTSDIVREYAAKYPDIFRVIIAEKNIFSSSKEQRKLKKKQRETLRGKYIGFCEGDDYWIDCNKLQIQVNYMESHPECSAYFHNALRMDCRNSSMETINPYKCDGEKQLSPDEVIMLYKGHPPTASVLFKREVLLGPDFVDLAPGRDYALELYALSKGNIHYNSRIMSVYRFFRKESYTEKIAQNKKFAFRFYLGMIAYLLQYDRYTEYKYHVWLTNRIQAYAAWFVYDIKSDEALQQYYDECKNDDYLLEKIYEECIEKIKCLRCQTFEKSYFDWRTKEFLCKYKNVILMGIGKYSAILTEQFMNNDVDFAGYVISNKECNTDYFMGKPVWIFEELPFDRRDTGIVVAINPKQWDDVLYSLEKAGIENYFCPFLLDKD